MQIEMEFTQFICIGKILPGFSIKDTLSISNIGRMRKFAPPPKPVFLAETFSPGSILVNIIWSVDVLVCCAGVPLLTSLAHETKRDGDAEQLEAAGTQTIQTSR